MIRPDGWTELYGRSWSPVMSSDGIPSPAPELMIHLAAFSNVYAHPELDSPLVREQSFRSIVDHLWGKESRFEFIWHPWADEMLKLACSQRYLGVAGCASSGKSAFFALWAIVNFISAPRKTQVIVASTQLSLAKKRIWKDVQAFWNALPERVRPGRLIPSLSVIVFQDPETEERLDGFGITLVAADKSHGESAKPKLIGIKAARVLLILDELPDLSVSMIDAASNLSKNPHFQMIGLGNPDSYFDAFGRFVKPKKGWDALSEADTEWETEIGGRCIRFDGEKSPNVLAGENIYPFLITQQNLDEDALRYGGTYSAGYYRMNRGFFRPTGRADSVYTEQEIIESGSNLRVSSWIGIPTRVIFLDPSFTNGGDRCLAREGFIGRVAALNLPVLELGKVHLLHEDVSKEKESRTQQICRQFAALCQELKIPARHVGIDATAGGGPFGDVLSQYLGNGFLRLNLAGSASEKPASNADRTPANKRYKFKVTEIWYGAKEMMRTGQLRNIDDELCRELVARTYRMEGGLIQVESKRELKKRIGKSCDLADASLGLVAIGKERFGMTAAGVMAPSGSFSGSRSFDQPSAKKFPPNVWGPGDNERGFGQDGGWSDHILGVPQVMGR